jgi:hypothetical protein
MSDPVVGVVCAQGEYTAIDPATALVIIALSLLAEELSKKEPFGPNNEIRKALETVIHDATKGLGPNNDIRRALENAWNDLTKGLGENNDLRKALERIGIRF